MKAKLKTLRAIDPIKPMVALTFDDGPSPEYTPEILEALKEHNAKATFFVLGTLAERNPDLLIQIAESGNEIGNHTYSHLDLTKLEQPAIDYQVLTTQEIIRRVAGKAPVLLRPSYGYVTEGIKNVAMPIILWSIDTLDWENKNSDVIYNIVMNNVKDGDIILMHEIYPSSVEAVHKILPELVRRGYQLLTVSELARARGISLIPGDVYSRL